MGVAVRFGLAILLLCAACGSDTPAPTTRPTPITPAPAFPPPFDATPFTGPVVPQFGGQWRAPVGLVGCFPITSFCGRLQSEFRFEPPVVRLTLTQNGNQLSGTLSIYYVHDAPVTGVVHSGGGFVLFGRRAEGSMVSGRFLPDADPSQSQVIVELWRSRDVIDSRWEVHGTVVRQ